MQFYSLGSITVKQDDNILKLCVVVHNEIQFICGTQQVYKI